MMLKSELTVVLGLVVALNVSGALADSETSSADFQTNCQTIKPNESLTVIDLPKTQDNSSGVLTIMFNALKNNRMD